MHNLRGHSIGQRIHTEIASGSLRGLTEATAAHWRGCCGASAVSLALI